MENQVEKEYFRQWSLRYAKAALIEKFGHKCAGCGVTNKKLYVHHFRYDWDCTIDDMILLCEGCHACFTQLQGEHHD